MRCHVRFSQTVNTLHLVVPAVLPFSLIFHTHSALVNYLAKEPRWLNSKSKIPSVRYLKKVPTAAKPVDFDSCSAASPVVCCSELVVPSAAGAGTDASGHLASKRGHVIARVKTGLMEKLFPLYFGFFLYCRNTCGTS